MLAKAIQEAYGFGCYFGKVYTYFYFLQVYKFFRLFGFGIRGSKSRFAFGIQGLDSESSCNFITP